jgi:large subunit ribosomal protein L25
MAKKLVLSTEFREEKGKGKIKRLRKTGKTPGIIFGRSGETIPVTFLFRDLEKIIYSDAGFNTIFTLNVDTGKKKTDEYMVMMKEYQLEPVTHDFLHVSFYRIHMDRVMELNVPLNVIGKSLGERTEEARLDIVNREILVRCLPADIPEHISIDITEMVTHDIIRMSDLVVDDKVEILSEDKNVVLHILPPRKIEEVAVDEDLEGIEGEEGVEGEEGEESEESEKGKKEKK